MNEINDTAPSTTVLPTATELLHMAAAAALAASTEQAPASPPTETEILRDRLDKIEAAARNATHKLEAAVGTAMLKDLRILHPERAKAQAEVEKLKTSAISLIKSHFATLWAAFGFLYNKAFAIAVLYGLAHLYLQLTGTAEAQEHGIAFIELLYAAVIIGSVSVASPFLRLLVFPEVARYAESGKVNDDLYGENAAVTPALRHYWIVTVGCYAVATIAMAMAMHLGK